MTNKEISSLLRSISAAYQILGENRFKIIAYDRAADEIEHLTSELKEIWQDGRLESIPGIGKGISVSLDELFKTGKVLHFGEVLSKLPASVFPLLLVPGIGPKKAYKLVTELHLLNHVTVVEDLEKAAHDHRIAEIEGFGEKSEEVILSGIASYKAGQIKENRMVLPEADKIAREVLTHIRQSDDVLQVDTLGSLRRKVSTIGDIDIAVATNNPDGVIDHFLTFPHEKLIDRGTAGSTILLHNGRQVDIRVQKPEAYGAMLQYFTGSKHHNIHLRTLANAKGLSLNEYGIKNIKSGKVTQFTTEEAFYGYLGLQYIPPELREDRGEIEAATTSSVLDLVELQDIRGDLHMHAKYDFPTSHDIGSSPIEEHLDQALKLNYEYIGISDHNPRITGQTAKEIAKVMEKRKMYYEKRVDAWKKLSGSMIQVFVLCEVDILTDGTLALPIEAFEFVDGVIVSLHSGFQQEKNLATSRILKALSSHPKVRIFGHPTGRLLTRRDGVDARWQEIYAYCADQDIALEINSYFDRLDLPDQMVFDAKKAGARFCIDTDSHASTQMNLMEFGVSVARRGWATKSDIINTFGYNDFSAWMLRRRKKV